MRFYFLLVFYVIIQLLAVTPDEDVSFIHSRDKMSRVLQAHNSRIMQNAEKYDINVNVPQAKRERERERERSLFAISLITSHITKSINGRLPERKNSIIAGHL